MKTIISKITNKNHAFTPHKKQGFTLAEVLKFSERGAKKCLHLFARASVNQEPTSKIKRHCAFTLAEVLITLAIIGVVAALTIPSVVQSYQKLETATRLKKAYNTINQAIQMAEVEYGSATRWDFCEFGGASPAARKLFEKYFEKNIPVLKSYPDDTNLQPRYKWLNGDVITTGWIGNSTTYNMILKDGMFLSMGPFSECSSGSLVFFLDVNGIDIKPNMVGKDVFYFQYRAEDKKIIPWCNGGTDKYINENCNKNGDGRCCANKIMRDGWEIKDDYPW